MAWYVEDKNGVRKKISGTSIDTGLKEVPIASETIVGGVISSTNSGSLSVNQSTGEAKINDNLTIEGGGQVVLEGDFGEPPYTITIDKNPPSASQTGYDNSISGLSATNVQNAIDEIVQNDNEQENKIVTNTLNITNLKDKTTYYSNKNLLDNWYFINPINQRGQTTYTGIGYTIDRFAIQNQQVTVNITDNGLVLSVSQSGNYSFTQLNERKYFNGNTITFSALYNFDNVVYLTSGVFDIPNDNINHDLGNYYLQNNYGYLDIVAQSDGRILFRYITTNLPADKNIAFIAWKVEVGSQQTLAHQDSSGNWVLNDAPPNPAEELLKCQRYFYRTIPDSNGYSLDGFGQATQENIVLTNFYFPTVMRDGGNPSITLSYGSKFALVNYANELWGNTTHNITNVTINQFHGNYVFLYLYSTNLIPGLHYFYQMNGGYIDFSRDL